MKIKHTIISVIALILFIGFVARLSFGQYIPNAPFKAAGVQAPYFSLKDLQGKTFQLRNYKGKPVLIFFGTTWCPNCRTELPYYKDIYKTYSQRDCEIIYINIMEPQGKVAKFVKANGLPFRILLDEDGSVAESFGVIGVPTIVLIDKNGDIIAAKHRTLDLPLKKVLPAK